MPVTGWVISSIVGGIIGTIFGVSIASLNKRSFGIDGETLILKKPIFISIGPVGIRLRLYPQFIHFAASQDSLSF